LKLETLFSFMDAKDEQGFKFQVYFIFSIIISFTIMYKGIIL